jgi:hypothetical protein
MSKIVNIYLGPAIGLSGRQLTITRMPRSGDVVEDMEAAYDEALGASIESAEVELDDDEIFQAVLVDTAAYSGITSKPKQLIFNTGADLMPGPGVDDFRVVAIETSSSSSSSSSGA